MEEGRERFDICRNNNSSCNKNTTTFNNSGSSSSSNTTTNNNNYARNGNNKSIAPICLSIIIEARRLELCVFVHKSSTFASCLLSLHSMTSPRSSPPSPP